MGHCFEAGGERAPANFSGSGAGRAGKESKALTAKGAMELSKSSICFAGVFRHESHQFAAAGRRTQASISVPRPFSLVRNTDSRIIARQMVSRPNDAVRMSTECLGRLESRPYTNSIWTQ